MARGNEPLDERASRARHAPEWTDDPGADDIHLAALAGIMRRRWVLVATTLVAGLAGTAALVGLSGRTYEAAATLALSGSAATGTSNANAVRTVLTSPAVLETVNDTLGREGRAVALDAEAVSVDPVPNTALVRLRVRLADSAAAARAVTLLAQRGGTVARQLRDRALQAAGPSLDADLHAAARELESAEQKLLEFRRAHPLEILEEDVKAQIATRRSAQAIAAELDRERARHKAATEELERLRGADRARASPETAPIIASLAQVAAESRTTIVALEQVQRKNAAAASADKSGLEELHRLQMEQTRLRRAVSVAEQVYASLMVRARQAPSVQAVPLMEVVDDVVPPGTPVARELWRKLALAVVLSLLLGAGLAIAVEALRPAGTYPRRELVR